MSWLAIIRIPVAFIVIGAAAGMVAAAGEIGLQGYLAQGLWRTCLWISRDHTVQGAAYGLVAGLALTLLVVAWRLRAPMVKRIRGFCPQLVSDSSWDWAQIGLIVFLAVSSVVAVLFVPASTRVRLHLPYHFLVVGLFAAVWLIALGQAAIAGRSQAEEPSHQAKPAWLAVTGLVYVVLLLRSWATAPKREVALTVLGGLAAYVIAYFLSERLLRLARSLLRRLISPRTIRRSVRSLAYIVLVAAPVLWVAAHVAAGQARAEAAERGLNVIVIAVDTLRADRVSLLAKPTDDRDLTPKVRDLLAARGTVFSSAISQAPWTAPAFASMFTGLYPEQHGLDYFPATLSPARLTLAEILREAGYRTLGVVSHGNVGSHVSMNQGFSVFDESPVRGHQAMTSAQVTDQALQLLKENRHEPFFLFVHYFDPHYNYLDHEEFYFSDEYRGWLRNEVGFRDQWMLLRMKEHLFGPPEHAFIRDLYDEEIAYTDMHIGRLLAFLDETNLWDSTLVIFTADHGEEFFEHGWIGHVITLYEELIHVPLVIAAPSRASSGTNDYPVETRWLFGTVLDFLGVSCPEGTTSTPSLLSSPSNEKTVVRSSTHPIRDPEGTTISAVMNVWLSCVVNHRWKLVKNHISGAVMLFDRASAARETRDLSSEHTDVRREFEHALDALNAHVMSQAPGAPAPEAGEEHLRELKALGYL